MIKKLLPSLLSFPISEWYKSFNKFKSSNINIIHFDVMDLEYVNNKCFDKNEFEYFLKFNDANLVAHVHLMVTNPYERIDDYINKKTEAISFHFDVYNNSKHMIIKTLEKIKNNNIMAGIAINPNFRLKDYIDYLDYCDLVTIMGVYPGKGGQMFVNSCLDNINDIINYNIIHNKDIKIEIDGGMNFQTINLVYPYCQYIVTGSFLKKHMDELNNIVEWFNSLN